MYKYLISQFLLVFHKKIKDFISEKKLFFIAGIILLVIFEILLGILFWGIFNYLVNYISGGYVFAPKILAIIMMIVFYIIVFLSFISTIPTLYKNKEVSFLLVNPISYLDNFKYGVFKVFFYSSFGSIFVLLPSLIAFGIANGYSISYYFFTIFVIFSLTTIATFLGVLLFLLFSKFILSFKRNIRNGIFLAIGVILLYFAFSQLPEIVIQKGDNEFTLLQQYIFSYNYSNLFYPYNWFVKLLDYVVIGDIIAIISYIFFIVSSILLLGYILFLLGKYYYFDSIENLNNFSLFKKKNKIKLKSVFGKSKYFNLIIKDVLVHIKDPVQWSQLLIFFLLIFIYIGVIKGMSVGEMENPNIATMLTLGNLGLSGFFISSIALRFVFPNISLEGKSFWILRTIPLNLKLFYILKIVFFSVFLLIISYILTYFYINIIGLREDIAIFLYTILFPIIILIVSIFFMMGSMYPDFKETNPSKIATSFPGLLSIFITNGFVFAILLWLYPTILNYYKEMLYCNILGLNSFWQEITIIYSICITFLILTSYIGYKRFKSIES